MSSTDKVILQGRVARIHGYPKNGVARWKIELFQAGSQVFRSARRVYFTKQKGEGVPNVFASGEAQAATLLAEAEPLGAEWDRSPSVLLSLPEDLKLETGQGVGVLRSDFPAAEGRDIYLCDLLGRTVTDPDKKDSRFGIQGFYDASAVAGISSWILVLKSVNEERLEVPLLLVLNEERNTSRWAKSDEDLFCSGLSDWSLDD